MSKFCQNCGAEMEEDAVFCTNCGTKEQQIETPSEEVSVETNAVNQFVDSAVEKVKANPKLLAFGGAAVVAVLAIVIILTTLFGGGYKKAIDNFVDVSFKGKVNKIEKLAPKEYWEYLEEEEDFDIDEAIEEYEDEFDDNIDELEDEYGKNIKVKYKITDKDKLSDKKIDKIAEALKDKYDIKKKSVKAGYEVDVELTIKGSEDDDENDATLTVIKIGGSWYIVSYYEYGDETYVNFMLGL